MPRTVGVTVHENTHKSATARVIFLGVPSFGMVSLRWHAHMMQLQNPLNRSVYHAYGIGFEVGQARNFLIKEALNWQNDVGHTVSHVFFVDDDVLVPPYALSVLLAAKRPIISGLYYAKTEAPQPLALVGPSEGLLDPIPRNQIVDVYAHGMGCTLIEIDVFKTLLERGMVEDEDVGGGTVLPQFFKTTRDAYKINEHTAPTIFNQTEDVFFLEKAAKVGFQPSVHTGVFGFHWDQKAGLGYPLHYWDEFKRTGNVIVGEEVAVA